MARRAGGARAVVEALIVFGLEAVVVGAVHLLARRAEGVDSLVAEAGVDLSDAALVDLLEDGAGVVEQEGLAAEYQWLRGTLK